MQEEGAWRGDDKPNSNGAFVCEGVFGMAKSVEEVHVGG